MDQPSLAESGTQVSLEEKYKLQRVEGETLAAPQSGFDTFLLHQKRVKWQRYCLTIFNLTIFFSISTTYHVAGMHRWSGHLNEFGGQDLALQWKSSSSELSPQSLSPSQSQYGSTQIVVFLHCIWPSGQVTFWSAQVTLDSSEVLLSLQSLIPLHFWLSGIHL